jgi:hypothetical protein
MMTRNLSRIDVLEEVRYSKEREKRMRQITVKAESVLEAPAEEVFATIADYRQGHPYILPKEFYALQVEKGGYGAGTIFRFKMRVLGVERSYYQRASEPEPDRVLVEQDIDSPQHVTTTFRVVPLEQGQKSHVEISTTMHSSPGVRGLVERLLLPLITPRIYQKELTLLEEVAQRRSAHA